MDFPLNSLMKSIAELGLLTDMHLLLLNGNSLTGSLSSELGLINGTRQSGLEFDEWTLDLNFSSNTLSGVVPEELCHFDHDNNNQTLLDFDCGVNICGCRSCECNDNVTLP